MHNSHFFINIFEIVNKITYFPISFYKGKEYLRYSFGNISDGSIDRVQALAFFAFIQNIKFHIIHSVISHYDAKYISLTDSEKYPTVPLK